MGMPCQVNSILKLSLSQGYPESLDIGHVYEGIKQGYRIIPIDVPIPLVDEYWTAYADVVLLRLRWEGQQTVVQFTLHRLYPEAFSMKGQLEGDRPSHKDL